MSDALVLSLIPAAVMIGCVVARIVAVFVPFWGMSLILFVYALFLADLGLPSGPFGFNYLQDYGGNGGGWSALGESILAIWIGLPLLIGMVSGWAWAARSRQARSDHDA